MSPELHLRVFTLGDLFGALHTKPLDPRTRRTFDSEPPKELWESPQGCLVCPRLMQDLGGGGEARRDEIVGGCLRLRGEFQFAWNVCFYCSVFFASGGLKEFRV